MLGQIPLPGVSLPDSESGLGSRVWSRRSPVDATCSALARAAGSNRGEHLGRSSGPAGLCRLCWRPCLLLLLQPLPAPPLGGEQSACQDERSWMEGLITGWLSAARSRAGVFTPASGCHPLRIGHQLTGVTPRSHQASLPPLCLPSVPHKSDLDPLRAKIFRGFPLPH